MDIQDVARRAVASPGWRWLSGMRLRSIRAYLRVVGLNGDGSLRLSWDDPGRPVEGDTYTVEHMGGALPDLTDPATVGCLLALVRAAWDDPHVYVLANGPDWFTVRSPNGEGGWLGPSPIDGSTEAAALVAALEAAP